MSWEASWSALQGTRDAGLEPNVVPPQGIRHTGAVIVAVGREIMVVHHAPRTATFHVGG